LPAIDIPWQGHPAITKSTWPQRWISSVEIKAISPASVEKEDLIALVANSSRN
jgi:hypothetical protein